MEVFLGPVELPWDACFLRNITIRGGVAPVKRYLPEVFALLEAWRIAPLRCSPRTSRSTTAPPATR
jgi:threonine dehydrogenase-like Zn-dependent dehydrogenase